MIEIGGARAESQPIGGKMIEIEGRRAGKRPIGIKDGVKGTEIEMTREIEGGRGPDLFRRIGEFLLLL